MMPLYDTDFCELVKKYYNLFVTLIVVALCLMSYSVGILFFISRNAIIENKATISVIIFMLS